MDKKVWGLLLIFIFCILMLPVVSASEMNDNNTETYVLSDDVLQYVTIDGEVLGANTKEVYFNASVEKDGDGSIDSPYKYLRSSRLNQITTAYFADGIYRLDNYRGIFNDLEFIGQSAENTIIRYDGMAFSIGVDSSLSATNITFLKASIRDFGVFVAEDCIFKDCVAAFVDEYGNSFGGAVYCKSGGISSIYSPGAFFTNCTFIDNNAAYGGAVYGEIGILSFSDCKFFNNSAKGYGGAVAAEDGSTLMVYDSIFDKDKSLDDTGGAIYGKTSSMIIRNSSFSNCQAFFGGAICNLRGQLDISTSKFKNNTAKYDGGAIYSMYGRTTSLKNDFESNAALNGGAIFVDNCTSVSINSNTFTSNAAITGGALYSNANVKLTNTSNTFDNNTALSDDDFHIQDNYPVVVNGNGNYLIVGNYTDWEGEIPKSYNLFDEGLVTPVRDQQAGGNCWGFASIATLESNILKAVNMSLDLSEENIKNVVELYSAYGWKRETNEGGYDAMSFAYIVSWLGAIYDELDTYDDYSTLSPVLDSVVHVQDIIFAPKRNNYTDNDEIKRMMLKYGAISAAYAHSNDYYNPSTYSYYYPNAGYANHAITVIGWDDSYSASNFLTTPPGDGAWIIKNSWNDTWGEKGFFYISYYDAILFKVLSSQEAYTFVFNNSVNFTKNYQYDFGGMTDYLITGKSSIWYANQFNSTGRDNIAAFSTYFDVDTAYEAYVYVNDELMLTQNGTSVAGYHTINLDELIPVNVGDTFRVALKITTSKYANIPISEKVMTTRTYYKPGVSYISFNGKKWIDLYNYTFGYGSHTYTSQVACLKIFAVDRPDSNTTITINSTDAFVGDLINITAEIRDEDNALVDSGCVNFTVLNQSYVVDVSNGLANIELTFDGEGIYNLSAVYSALKYYLPSNTTAVVNVSKLTPEITVNISDILYGDDLIADIDMSDDLDNLTLTVGDNVFAVDKSHFVIPLTLDVGVYEALLNYGGSDKYNAVSNVTSFKISPKDISMDVSVINISDAVNITVSFTENINDNVSIIVENESYSIPIKNSTAILRLSGLESGIYDVLVNFTNKNYMPKSFKTSFEVENAENELITEDLEKYFSSSKRFVAKLIDSKGNACANESVVFEIYGLNYTRVTNSDGIASIAINLNPGTYNITTRYNNSLSKTNTVNVLSTVESENLVKYYRNASQFEAKILDSEGRALANEKVSLNINGVFYYRTSNNDGIVRLNINLNPGVYIITLLNTATGEQKASNVTVLSKLVENNDLIKYYRNASKYSIKVLDDVGNPLSGVNVSFNINGVFYTRTTNASGVASLNINLNPGKYIITADYGGLMVSNNITVLTVLLADDLEMKYRDGSTFDVTVLDDVGSPLRGANVLFNINGVFYNRVSDLNGIAKLNINLMSGKYIITSSYNNLNIANKITII
ncbi:C1 family peptidase [Methanobrevibacter sp.]|uniref:C1 family peptidase n=1 Tax=Methanobrevibacter sp. TaxID=66852 RepID=UPI00388E26FA